MTSMWTCQSLNCLSDAPCACAGRAGNKGTAITFIGPDEERYAPDLVKALKESSAVVPQDLQDLATAFHAKCKAGTAHVHGSGFGGSGFKFDAGEEDAQRAHRQVHGWPPTSDLGCRIVRSR